MDDWRKLVRNIAAVAGATTLGVAIALRDPDAAILTAGLAISLVLLHVRRGMLGLIGLALAFGLTAFWQVIGAVVNLTHNSTFFADALTSVLAVLSLAGLFALAAIAFNRRPAGARRAGTVSIAAVFIALAGSFAASRSPKAEVRPYDIKLTAEHIKFSSKRIFSNTTRVGVAITNRDFFWHTFTIDKLHVNLSVPTRGHARIDFSAPRGTYEFKCLIPGHTQAGMKGTLVVR